MLVHISDQSLAPLACLLYYVNAAVITEHPTEHIQTLKVYMGKKNNNKKNESLNI